MIQRKNWVFVAESAVDGAAVCPIPTLYVAFWLASRARPAQPKFQYSQPVVRTVMYEQSSSHTVLCTYGTRKLRVIQSLPLNLVVDSSTEYYFVYENAHRLTWD